MLGALVFGCSQWKAQSEQLNATTEATQATAITSSNADLPPRTPMSKPPFQKPSDERLKQQLEPISYAVTQHDATEPPFRNRYWDHHEEGLYVDIVSGEPLFSSKDKFDSGTGWPSFTSPVAGAVLTRTDDSLGVSRTEVRSRRANSHLGHVFDDGPAPNGLRYCVNSAALRFIPKDKLVEEGYGQYLPLIQAGAALPSDRPHENSSNVGSAAAGCQATLEIAYLAGGCFWGVEDILRRVPGVVETEVGYMGGTTSNPTYDDVKAGKTGHAESVRITFDPVQLPYATLLENWFFRLHDPTTPNRQGNDQGTQYRSAIFVASDQQRATATEVLERVQNSGLWKRPIVTEIVSAGSFTPAESYHQDYLVKHPDGYTCHYVR